MQDKICLGEVDCSVLLFSVFSYIKINIYMLHFSEFLCLSNLSLF